jgi:hydroxymethylbilane synthase
MSALRLGTRRSALAMAQATTMAEALTQRTGRAVELVAITSRGDESTEPLAQIGGTGVFVTALRAAIQDGRVDAAVHSLKDLPTAPADGIVLAAVPQREDPRDALVARDGNTLATLPSGSVIGTGSPRRAAQLRMVAAARGTDWSVVGLRGNVDTRLQRVHDGDLDAVVLAHAGLRRLGRTDEVTEVLEPHVMLPAPGQGALALECRADDADTFAALASLDVLAARAAVVAERSLLAALEAGCTAPVGALANVDSRLTLTAVAASGDGNSSVRGTDTGSVDDPEGLGRRLADRLLADGARTLMEETPQ